MVWLSLFAVSLLVVPPSVFGLLNSTSVIVRPDGWTTYPCNQFDHLEPELDSSMMGLWYAIENIQHREDPRKQGAQITDSCPKLNIYKVAPKEIRINWQDGSGDIIYNFHMADAENLGFWLAWGKQTGSKATKQFEGSVQVLEAEPNRLVLTFCSLNRSHYTIVLVRNITVQHDTTPIHRKLAEYKLPVYSTSLTCHDALGSSHSIIPFSTLTATLLTFAVLFFYRWY